MFNNIDELLKYHGLDKEPNNVSSPFIGLIRDLEAREKQNYGQNEEVCKCATHCAQCGKRKVVTLGVLSQKDYVAQQNPLQAFKEASLKGYKMWTDPNSPWVGEGFSNKEVK